MMREAMVCIVNDHKYLAMKLGSVPTSSILRTASVNLMNLLVVCWLKHYMTIVVMSVVLES